MTWQHKPDPSPDLTREELEKVLSLCGSDPSLESVRLKIEESLSVHREYDRLLKQARINEEERRKERSKSEERLWKEAVWTLFDPAVREKYGV